MFKETKTIIPSKVDAKILLFSDIHYTGRKDYKMLNKLLNKVKTYSVDYICIPGDLLETYVFDNIIESNYFIEFLKKLSSISKVIISLGNHDISKKKDRKEYYNKEFWNRVNNIDNLYFLNNKGMIIDNIYFYGFTGSLKYYYKYKSENAKLLLEEINKNNVVNNLPNKYKILLMHSPIRLDNEEVRNKLNVYDIIMSGHMHNGLVLPLLDELFNNDIGFIAPNKTLFPRFSRGVIKDKNIIIISSAITKLSNDLNVILRLFNNLFPISLNYIILSTKEKEFVKSIKYF